MNTKKSIIIQESWKEKSAYHHGLYGTPIHTAWRAFRFTIKGKIAGCSEEWKLFNNFLADMQFSYFEGASLCREDKMKPFSRDNCFWTDKSNIKRNPKRLLEYNGEMKSIQDWCYELELNLTGVCLRYHRKNYKTSEEILFGKKRKKRRDLLNSSNLFAKELFIKASKMRAAYKCKDLKKNLALCDMDNEWFINNILKSLCYYCGTSDNLGADRINNNKGHTKDNCVPACFQCNSMRGNRFSVDQMKKIGKFLRDEIYSKEVTIEIIED